MSERRGGPFDLFTVNDAKFYQRSLLVEDGLMGACAKTRGVTPNTWMKPCAHFPGPAVPARHRRVPDATGLETAVEFRDGRARAKCACALCDISGVNRAGGNCGRTATVSEMRQNRAVVAPSVPSNHRCCIMGHGKATW